MDPFSAGMFASIGSAFKFADVAVRIAEVGSENAVFVRTICIVRSDLEEVERLLSLESVQKKLAGTPGKLHWIKTAICNTRYALNDIGKWVERARVEQETTGSINFATRVRWVFNDHEKLLNRKTELSTCHQQLSNVLGYLVRLEGVPANTIALEYENADYFDEILSKHRRITVPKAPKARIDTTKSAQDEGLPGAPTARLEFAPPNRPSPVLGAWSLQSAQTIIAHDRSNPEGSPISSTVSPPGSPPPTYAAAVSIGPVLHDTHLKSHNQARVGQTSASSQPASRKDVSTQDSDNVWAYRSRIDSMRISEAAGDTVLFSATNSAGPVNPYELCTNPWEKTSKIGRKAQEPSETLAEMLGDLYFPVELPSNDPRLQPGCSPRTQARSDQMRLSRSRHTQLRKRTISETPPVVHHRPAPTSALSNSLLAGGETPTSLAMHKSVVMSTEPALHLSGSQPLATELSSKSTHQTYMPHRPAFYTAQTPIWTVPNLSAQSTRHYSAPPPISFNENAAAYSADSTSSWGLDTQPKVPKAPNAQDPATATRMQSQKQIMDLLGSISN